MIRKLLVPVLFLRAACLWAGRLFRKPGIDNEVFCAESAVVLNGSSVHLHWNCAGSYLVHLKHGGWYTEKGSALVFPVKGLQHYELTVYGPGKKTLRTSVKRIDVDLTRTCQQAGFHRQNIAQQLLRSYASVNVAPHHFVLRGRLVTCPSHSFQPQPYESIVLLHS